MKNYRQDQSQYDSSEDQDCFFRPPYHKNIQNLHDEVNRELQSQDLILKPKMNKDLPLSNINKQGKQKIINQKMMENKSLVSNYTFKLKKSNKVKKHDPVSLYKKNNESWTKDRFLRSRGDNKEGRKLKLDKRNRQFKVL